MADSPPSPPPSPPPTPSPPPPPTDGDDAPHGPTPTPSQSSPRNPNDPMTWAERSLFPSGAAPPLGPHHPPIPRRGAAHPLPPPAREATDERCWIKTRQTNARRALGREPRVTMYCYINLRRQIADLIPVPGQPGAFLARDSPKPTGPKPYVPAGPPTALSNPPELPAYHWPALDGRYLYIAHGREVVAHHIAESGGPPERRVGIEEIAQRCEEAKVAREGSRRENAVKRALGMVDDEDDEYERVISLTNAYSQSLQRFHLHLHRIYSPGLRNVARLPEVWADGTAMRMVERCREKLTDGSAFKLVERMYESTVRVMGILSERRRNQRGGPGDGGPGGPVVPPVVGGSGGVVPPPMPPPIGGPPPM